MGDVVCPGGAAVRLAGKGVALGSGVGGPAAAEAGGCEGAEEAAVGALGLDDHEVLGLALEGVNLDGFEEVVCGVAHDDGGGGSEAAGEAADGHAGAVDFAVVSGEEQVHVLAVADDGLVNGSGAGAGDRAAEQGLSGRPAVGIAGVAGSAVREGGGSPLVGEDPSALGSKVEEGGGDSRRAHGVLACRGHLGPVREEAKIHGTISTGAVVGSVHEVLAVVVGRGEILERNPTVLRRCQGSG